jgi:hypothetical protein
MKVLEIIQKFVKRHLILLLGSLLSLFILYNIYVTVQRHSMHNQLLEYYNHPPAESPRLLRVIALAYIWHFKIPVAGEQAPPSPPPVEHLGTGAPGEDGTWPILLSMPAPRVVVSVGIRDDYSFDVDINRKYDCEVHAFDPTVNYPDILDNNPRIHFHRQGLSGQPYTHYITNLPTIMSTYNITYIDVLKIDCEGCEFDVFKYLISDTPQFLKKNVGQILFELHMGARWPEYDITGAERWSEENSEQIIDHLHNSNFGLFYAHLNTVSSYIYYRNMKIYSCFEMGWAIFPSEAPPSPLIYSSFI